MSGSSDTNEFDFYLRFAKPLVLNLKETNGKFVPVLLHVLLITLTIDRVLAAAWIKKLRSPDVGSEKLRADYLKLLLFVLQRKRLAGPFSENPNQYEKLEEFPESYNVCPK